LLLYLPDIEHDALEVLHPFRLTDKQRVVQSGIAAILRCLKLWCRLKVIIRITLRIFSVAYQSPVTYMDIDAIVRLDAVDGLELFRYDSISFISSVS